jgi:hypothetical protein
MKLRLQHLAVLFPISVVFLDLYLRAQVPDDVRDQVRSSSGKKEERSGLIEIGKSIFGHPFGETEEEFIKKEGKPDGYFSLANGRTVLVYGKKTGFIFDEGKLNGIRIDATIFDWKLSEQIDRKSRFDSIKWRTNAGACEDLSLESLRKLYGKELLEVDRDFLFRKDGYVLQFDMSTFINRDGSEGKKSVHGILLTKE